ncbi:MAG: glutamine synthetase III [Clostridiales bacterium]|nr:glutamine synthetase III [Clostridia bacterium]MCR4906461.1 glutamine synthetase III [Clostridiales bacterium]
MALVSEYFGCNAFDDGVMKERLPKDTYRSLRKTIDEGRQLDLEIANVVANAMKDWAIERGCTHFTHWFQPLTGVTAEKHDSFISPIGDGRVIMEFSGKELVRGEPDASSFPSGGLRATFEARGYTAWDPTSYAFIKDRTLCVPTAFCSYGGETLDKKTPLLRSMDALNQQTMRILRLFDPHTDVACVRTSVGPEQEYFLIPKKLYNQRRDLIFTGRTLFGAKPPKGQELDDHYFGTLKPQVDAFMKELDEELWKLGILAKTEHNEAAPAQHELAPIYTQANVATDHNQLTMEMMQKVAKRHDLVCLLHEKPFEGVNGSGKHNNWSISTNTGINLLTPGETPSENAQFLLFLCAVIQAVDEYQDLLRISAASAGNDHRLGAAEAPPAVVSIFLGTELTAILETLEAHQVYNPKAADQLQLGSDVLPKFPKDNTDRNRTSPFAFTGNKFEFRMVGSSQSIADCNTVLNTAVAEVLRVFADRLEAAPDFREMLNHLIRKTVREHRRIIFNGNGYDDAWIKEATEVRHLSNLLTTPEALPHFLDEKNIRLFTSHKVYTETEMRSRYEIALENYVKTIRIEANTMIDMTRKEILPAVTAYAKATADAALSKKQLLPGIDTSYEEELVKKLTALTASIQRDTLALADTVKEAEAIGDNTARAFHAKDSVLPIMNSLRAACDEAESLTAETMWPYPTYAALLFGVE